MSFFSRNPKAQAAIDALRPDSTGGILSDMSPMRQTDWDALRDVLTAATCPLPCKGRRVDNFDSDWHEECESRAEKALGILRGLGLAP